MSEQQQVSRQDYFISQQLESLARQNANQAMRISQLEAELLTLKAEMQQAQG
jgi:capsule polysaccharide export protein KpsE/RkpR